MIALVAGQKDSSLWILDSGASDHYVSNRSGFIEYTKKDGEVRVGSGEVLAVHGVGTVAITTEIDGEQITVKLSNVYHVPEITMNLISLSQLKKKTCKIVDYENGIGIEYEGKPILVGNMRNALFHVDVEINQSYVTEGENAITREHKRLGHMGKESLVKLACSIIKQEPLATGISLETAKSKDKEALQQKLTTEINSVKWSAGQSVSDLKKSLFEAQQTSDNTIRDREALISRLEAVATKLELERDHQAAEVAHNSATVDSARGEYRSIVADVQRGLQERTECLARKEAKTQDLTRRLVAEQERALRLEKELEHMRSEMDNSCQQHKEIMSRLKSDTLQQRLALEKTTEQLQVADRANREATMNVGGIRQQNKDISDHANKVSMKISRLKDVEKQLEDAVRRSVADLQIANTKIQALQERLYQSKTEVPQMQANANSHRDILERQEYTENTCVTRGDRGEDTFREEPDDRRNSDSEANEDNHDDRSDEPNTNHDNCVNVEDDTSLTRAHDPSTEVRTTRSGRQSRLPARFANVTKPPPTSLKDLIQTPKRNTSTLNISM
jgi:hypothetical protein